jgi:6-phosphogluconolactonase
MKSFVTLLLTLGLPAMAHAETLLYVSDAGNQRIIVYRIGGAPGELLTQIQTVDVKAAPGSLAVGDSVFASLRSTFQLASYRISKSDKLEWIHTVSLERDCPATYVAKDQTGKYLFWASYQAGRVGVHGIGTGGKLSEKPLQVIETAKTAHAAVVTRDNRWVFVPHVEPNAIFQFRFDEKTGNLTLHSKAPGGKEGAGPRHLAIHPSLKFACSSDETGNSVTLYSLNAETGLKPLQTLSTLPDDFTGKNSTADVKFHPSGRFVWVSNRGHDSLAGFRFDEAAGKLTALGQTPTEKTPRSFEVLPSGNFVFAAGEGSGKLAAYSIDNESGRLDRTATYETGKSLTWVSAVEWSWK